MRPRRPHPWSAGPRGAGQAALSAALASFAPPLGPESLRWDGGGRSRVSSARIQAPESRLVSHSVFWPATAVRSGTGSSTRPAGWAAGSRVDRSEGDLRGFELTQLWQGSSVGQATPGSGPGVVCAKGRDGAAGGRESSPESFEFGNACKPWDRRGFRGQHPLPHRCLCPQEVTPLILHPGGPDLSPGSWGGEASALARPAGLFQGRALEPPVLTVYSKLLGES